MSLTRHPRARSCTHACARAGSEYAWEKVYERPWEGVIEDESGNIVVTNAAKRARTAALESYVVPAPVALHARARARAAVCALMIMTLLCACVRARMCVRARRD
ncbi:hypothetical protein EON67_11905, partial [archaeon]